MRIPFTYNDGLFLRALELGCEPANASEHGLTMWMCTCSNREHGSGTQRYITEFSLDAVRVLRLVEPQ